MIPYLVIIGLIVVVAFIFWWYAIRRCPRCGGTGVVVVKKTAFVSDNEMIVLPNESDIRRLLIMKGLPLHGDSLLQREPDFARCGTQFMNSWVDPCPKCDGRTFYV